MNQHEETNTRREFVSGTTALGALGALGIAADGADGPANPIGPSPEDMQTFLALPDTGPLVMLNLLKFKPDGGQAAYMRYAAAVGPLLEKVGAEVVFMGQAHFPLVSDTEWDSIALVRYPSKKAFLEMISSPDYQAAHPDREEGLAATVLYAFKPFPAVSAH